MSAPIYRSTPWYDDIALVATDGPMARSWEFSGWKQESLSWKRTAYIHAGLSGGGMLRYTGPDALTFLQGIVTNSLARFPVGSAKHAVMCTEEGLIAGHGVLKRAGEQDFTLYLSGLWAAFQHSRTQLDVQQELDDEFVFQIAGPRSLEIVEAATGEDQHDLRFLRFRDTTVAGHPVEIMRVGMANTLAYELHGPMAIAPEVYDAVLAAGLPFGIERLGWRTYTVNHVEGGFPQSIWTFATAGEQQPDMLAFLTRVGLGTLRQSNPTGSVDHADMRARFRTPYDLGWDRMVAFDHEFIGRSSLEAITDSPPRCIVTLEWNAEDVVDIYASLFRPGPEYLTMDLPTTPSLTRALSHADDVRIGEASVGWSSGTIYSYHFRKMLSHATIDVEHAEIGTEVVVRWGEPDGPIKDVRATVARYPYFADSPNQSFDIESVPRIEG